MRRHDLLQVEPSSWRVMLESRPDLAGLKLLPDWAARGWPVIVRRRLDGESSGEVPAALPLPPSHGKKRIALSFPKDAGLTSLPPLELAGAVTIAPPGWRRTIDGVLALGITPHVFGSLLWQYRTRLPYLSPRSDLDLLWRVADARSGVSLVEALLRLEADGPVRLDGELELPDGGAVNWREWAFSARSSSDSVLVKTMDGVSMRKIDQLFAAGASAP